MGGREGEGWERGRKEGGRKRGKEEGREGKRQGGRKGGREVRRERRMEGRREFKHICTCTSVRECTAAILACSCSSLLSFSSASLLRTGVTLG